jgi:hypothetical protein
MDIVRKTSMSHNFIALWWWDLISYNRVSNICYSICLALPLRCSVYCVRLYFILIKITETSYYFANCFKTLKTFLGLLKWVIREVLKSWTRYLNLKKMIWKLLQKSLWCNYNSCIMRHNKGDVVTTRLNKKLCTVCVHITDIIYAEIMGEISLPLWNKMTWCDTRCFLIRFCGGFLWWWLWYKSRNM